MYPIIQISMISLVLLSDFPVTHKRAFAEWSGKTGSQISKPRERHLIGQKAKNPTKQAGATWQKRHQGIREEYMHLHGNNLHCKHWDTE